jgi:ribosomal protein S27AE
MMKKYRVMLEGRNFLLDIEGSVKKYGFFTTRYVEAEDFQQAEMKAMQLIREDQVLKTATKNESSKPMIYLESITELESFEGLHLPGTGYSFFPDESDYKIYNLPNARLAVIQTLLMAVGSWVFSLWLIRLPFLGSRSYIFGGLSVCGILVICIIISSIPLICPKCGKRMAFTKQYPPFLPDWEAIKQQYFPVEAVSRRHAKCPHCGAEISLQKRTTPNNGIP